jgi:hypothetical protein
MSKYNNCPALSSGIPEVCRDKCKQLRQLGLCQRDKDEQKEAEDE